MGNAGRIYDSGKMNLRRKKVRPGFSSGRIDVPGPLEVFFAVSITICRSRSFQFFGALTKNCANDSSNRLCYLASQAHFSG
jgi:hypothetical protein